MPPADGPDSVIAQNGCEKVRNYDGSWTGWGNAVRAPIEKGPPA